MALTWNPTALLLLTVENQRMLWNICVICFIILLLTNTELIICATQQYISWTKKGTLSLYFLYQHITTYPCTMTPKDARGLTSFEGECILCGLVSAGEQLGQPGMSLSAFIIEPVSAAVPFENTPTLLQCAGAQNWCWMTPLFLPNPHIPHSAVYITPPTPS